MGPASSRPAGSAVAVAVMAPGVPQLVNSVTGAGPILYRLMWVAALPVLVGVLATAPVPAPWPARWCAARPPWPCPRCSSVLVVVGGQLIWSRSTTLEDGPRWKYSHAQLQRARWVAATYDGDGPVLGPVAAHARARPHDDAGARRGPALLLPRQPRRAGRGPRGAGAPQRVDAQRQHLPPPELADDLAALGVEYVCLDAPKARYREAITELGWDPVASRSGVTCFRQG